MCIKVSFPPDIAIITKINVNLRLVMLRKKQKIQFNNENSFPIQFSSCYSIVLFALASIKS
jgi:hypothetical protein